MKISILKTKALIFLLILFAGIIFVYTACQKQKSNTDSTPLIAAAHVWFTNELVKKENDKLASLSNSAGDSYIRRFARMGKLKDLLNWNEAKEYVENSLNYVISPVKENLKPFKNQNFEVARFFAFYRNNSGKMQMNIIEILSKKGRRLEGSISQIASIAFTNKYFRKSNNLGNTNASIIFYNLDYDYETSFEIKNGLWSPAKINLRNKDEIKNRIASTRSLRTTCQTCVHWYLVGIWYNMQTGQIIDYEILDEWDECTENSPPPPGYGDSPTPPNDQECNDALNTFMNDNAATPTNEVGSSATTNGNDCDAGTNERCKTYPWMILRQNQGLWALEATEIGKHSFQNNEWKWISLTHKEINVIGTVIGGGITPIKVSAFSSIGLYWANMELKYKVTYSLLCKGFPIGTTTPTQTTVGYFNVNN
jgi:hypothetical protein